MGWLNINYVKKNNKPTIYFMCYYYIDTWSWVSHPHTDAQKCPYSGKPALPWHKVTPNTLGKQNVELRSEVTLFTDFNSHHHHVAVNQYYIQR